MVKDWDLPLQEDILRFFSDSTLPGIAEQKLLDGELQTMTDGSALLAYDVRQRANSIVLYHAMSLTKEPVCMDSVMAFLTYESVAHGCHLILQVGDDDQLQVLTPQH